MTSRNFEAGCCGLRAASQLLTDAGIAVPDQRQVITHEPALLCTCDALFVSIGPSLNTTRQNTDPSAGVFGALGLQSACGVSTWTTSYEVFLSRCVVVQTDDHPCVDDGDCADMLVCDGGDPPPRPGPCEPAANKAIETYWLLAERELLERRLATEWTRCLCEGWCGDEECRSGCSPQVEWIGSTPFDSGGCGGVQLQFQIHWF